MAEVTGSQSETRDYAWLGNRTLATFAGGTTHYVHNDHRATPRRLTDEAANVVWTSDPDPYGGSDPQGSVTFNLRLPGQHHDAETGLHHNHHRTYDPDTGRYITADPIGLEGGLNPYRYAGNSPLVKTDPTGLWVPQAIGAFVNASFEGYRQYQAGSFDAGKILVAGATGAIGGFGSTPVRAIMFGAIAGSTQNMYKQINNDPEIKCNNVELVVARLDFEEILRSAAFGASGDCSVMEEDQSGKIF